MNNTLKTTLLLAFLTALLLAAGALLGGRAGLTFAFMLAAIMNLSAYWFSDKIVLALYRAREIDARDGTGLYHIVRELAKRADMPMPRVYIIDDNAPNAFATGRNPQHASVAATSGILKLLTLEELTGVMAHELSHVRHRDTLIGAMAATIAGAISTLANMAMWASMVGGGDRRQGNGVLAAAAAVLTMIFAPMAAALIQMAISRSREFAADAGGAQLCGEPMWLASALEKIHRASQRIISPLAESHPATAHLFIINPLHGQQLTRLFTTHPPVEERIRRLREMASV